MHRRTKPSNAHSHSHTHALCALFSRERLSQKPTVKPNTSGKTVIENKVRVRSQCLDLSSRLAPYSLCVYTFLFLCIYLCQCFSCLRERHQRAVPLTYASVGHLLYVPGLGPNPQPWLIRDSTPTKGPVKALEFSLIPPELRRHSHSAAKTLPWLIT